MQGKAQFQFLCVSACQYMHVHDMSVKPEEGMWKNTTERERDGDEKETF